MPDVEGFHALALQRPIKPPLTEKEIGAKEKDVKRLRDSVTLVADFHGHFLVEPIIKRHTRAEAPRSAFIWMMKL